MQRVPLRVKEAEVWVTSGRVDLRDTQDVSLSFLGVPPDWAEIDNGLQISCQAAPRSVAVRLEAWMDEPPGHEEQWDDRSELLIDWTSGWVWLDDCDSGAPPRLSFSLVPLRLPRPIVCGSLARCGLTVKEPQRTPSGPLKAFPLLRSATCSSFGPCHSPRRWPKTRKPLRPSWRVFLRARRKRFWPSSREEAVMERLADNSTSACVPSR